MSTIQKLEDRISKLKVGANLSSLLPKNSGWLSRKLLVTLALVGGLIFLGRDNITLVIYGIIILGSVYMVTQTLHDIFVCREDGMTRRQLITAMASDGLSPEETKALTGGSDQTKIVNG